MSVPEILSVGAVILASLGGGGAIVLAMSGWLGKIWAERLMERERHAHAAELETIRAKLVQDNQSHLEQLRHAQRGEIDLLMRRREVYDGMARSMRIFLSDGRAVHDRDRDRQEFLTAYDTCFLWASDDVVESLGKFLDSNVQSARGNRSAAVALPSLYADALMRMRRDAGFPESSDLKAQYRLVTFGDWQPEQS